MGTTFEFSYAIRNFVALETLGSKPAESPFDSWSDLFLGNILNIELNSMEKNQQYSGRVSIDLTSLELTGMIVGVDKITRLQPHKSGGYAGLPTAVLKVKIEINNIGDLLKKNLSRLIEEANRAAPISLLEETLGHRERVNDESQGTDFRSQLAKNYLARVSRLQEEFSPVLEELGVTKEVLGSITPEKVMSALPIATNILAKHETSKEQSRAFLAEFLEIYKSTVRDFDDSFDVKEVEEFGNHLFLIGKEAINTLIRNLKYNHSQFWLEEIVEDSPGYFYIQNEVFMDSKGPLIPIARHLNTINMLDPMFLISLQDWHQIRSELHAREKLDALTIGRILTQAERSLQEGYLEAAVVISHVALEAALTNLIEYVLDGKSPPATIGRKVAFIQCLANGAIPENALFHIDGTDWRLIEGKPKAGKKKPRKYYDYEDGLIPVRNDVQHKSYFPVIGRKRVGEYLLATRRVSSALAKWIETKPPKGMLDDCERMLN